MPRLLIAALAALLSFGASAHHAPGPIHIAAVLTLSGPSVLPGKAALDALRLDIGRVNAAGALRMVEVRGATLVPLD